MIFCHMVSFTLFTALCILCLCRQEQDIQGAFGGIPAGGQLGDGCEKRLIAEQTSVGIGLENLSVAKFLEEIGLSCLQDIFDKEQITMDILVEMGHDELKDIGISAYGHRHKILKRIERITVLYGMLLLPVYLFCMIFSTQQNICRARCMLSTIRLSARHTDGSVKNS